LSEAYCFDIDHSAEGGKTMRKRNLAFLAGVLVFSLMIGGFTPAYSAKEGPDKILIGSPASLTGMFAGFGQGQSWGAKAAVEDINKQGGVMVKEFGRKIPLEIILSNTESNPQKAGALSEQMIIGKKVHFLVTGNEPPPMHSLAASMAARYNVVHLAHSAVLEPWLAMGKNASPPWKNTWAFGFSIAAGAQPGDFRHKQPGFTILDTWMPILEKVAGQTNKKAGVFSSDTPDGRGWYSVFPTALQKKGFEVCGYDKKLGLFPGETTDFSLMISKWKKDKVEVLWGNCSAPQFGALWRQARAMGFKPKLVFCGKAPANYLDVSSWGGDLPLGIGLEVKWSPSFATHGFGETTPKSLAARWSKDTGQPLNDNIGLGYYVIQVLVDAIERAGALDTASVNKALAQTDLMTINARVRFDKNRFSIIPLNFGQWHKVDTSAKWELKLVATQHDFVKPAGDFIFPIPYK
jgi:ABC-type branched-subunit amino acid transport system substrate-binding protein